MSEPIRLLQKENPGITYPGKTGSARKNVLGSISKKNKALTDVKNTVYLRNTTKTEETSKKKLAFDDNLTSCSEESEIDSLFDIMGPPVPLIIDSTNNKIGKEITSGRMSSRFIEYDELDVDDCPSCMNCADADDWLEDFEPLDRDDELRKFSLFADQLCDSPTPEMTDDDVLKMLNEAMSASCLDDSDFKINFSPMKMSDEYYSINSDDFLPVVRSDSYNSDDSLCQG